MTPKCDILIYPLLLEFFADDFKSLQQELHLHNQFDFTIKFKVLTTAPKKYTVTNPEGTIPPKTSVELIVKHSGSNFGPDNVTDQLRFKFYHENTSSKRDIPLYSIVSRKEHVLSQMFNKTQMSQSTYSNESDDKYVHSPYSGNSLNDLMAIQNERSRPKEKKTLSNRQKFYTDPIALYNGDNVNYLVIVIGLICLLILFLPNYVPETSQTNNYLPLYLHVSYEIKMFCSFILGMVTMVILKN